MAALRAICLAAVACGAASGHRIAPEAGERRWRPAAPRRGAAGASMLEGGQAWRLPPGVARQAGRAATVAAGLAAAGHAAGGGATKAEGREEAPQEAPQDAPQAVPLAHQEPLPQIGEKILRAAMEVNHRRFREVVKSLPMHHSRPWTDGWAEADVMRELQGPRIITLEGVKWVPKGPHGMAVVMTVEAADGDVYRDVVHRSQVDLQTTVQLMVDLLYGLQHIHEKGYVHRDITPGNLYTFGDSRSSSCRLKIGGLSSACSFRPGPHSCEEYEPAGTWPYVPPELAYHVSEDPKRDVWSAGAVFYAMLFHKVPNLMPKRGAEPDMNMAWATMLHPDLVVIMEHMLRPHPEERCTAAEALMGLLLFAERTGLDIRAADVEDAPEPVADDAGEESPAASDDDEDDEDGWTNAGAQVGGDSLVEEDDDDDDDDGWKAWMKSGTEALPDKEVPVPGPHMEPVEKLIHSLTRA